MDYYVRCDTDIVQKFVQTYYNGHFKYVKITYTKSFFRYTGTDLSQNRGEKSPKLSINTYVERLTFMNDHMINAINEK